VRGSETRVSRASSWLLLAICSCLHVLLSDLEDEGNVGKILADYTASYPRR
jgi:hypothetical protein